MARTRRLDPKDTASALEWFHRTLEDSQRRWQHLSPQGDLASTPEQDVVTAQGQRRENGWSLDSEEYAMAIQGVMDRWLTDQGWNAMRTALRQRRHKRRTRSHQVSLDFDAWCTLTNYASDNGITINEAVKKLVGNQKKSDKKKEEEDFRKRTERATERARKK